MKVLGDRVRLKSRESLTPLARQAIAVDGSTDIIPNSQIYGQDYDVVKSEAYWISDWILRKKSLQYSQKKKAYFDKDTRKRLPEFIIEKHNPGYVKPVEQNIIADLKSE